MWQLRVMLHALGYFGANAPAPDSRAAGANSFTPDVIAAVDSFRVAENIGASASPAGLVDAELVARLWAALEKAGKAREVRAALLDATAVRR